MKNDTQEKINELKNIILESTEITSITEETEYITEKGKQLPPFTRIRLVSKPSETSLIFHELWLPNDWNGIFLGTGNGGIGGKIVYKVLEHGVWKRCAAINTDMGSSNGRVRGVKDPEVWKDYGWRATALMTKVGKQITEAFYGEKIKHSYFFGASTGGQQALMLAQRYPTEYNGIIAGVPANDRTHLHTYFLWCWNKMRGASGQLLFKREDFAAITERAAEYSAKSGLCLVGEKFVSIPSSANEFIDGFIDYLSKCDPSLTAEQLSALKDIYSGPVDVRTGKQIYCGMPIGSECIGCGMIDMLGEESPHFYPFVWTFGEGYDGRNFDFSADMETVDNELDENLNANNADLREFFDNGGKLFMYSGSADPCVPFQWALRYYARVSIRCGPRKTYRHLRYFVIPGQDHKAGVARYGKAVMNGDVVIADNLAIIRKWCEEGVDPRCFDVVTPNGGESTVTKRIFAWE